MLIILFATEVIFEQLASWIQSKQSCLFFAATFRADWTVSIWADCGERMKNVLYLARLLQDDIRIAVKLNYFCPRHGHSECDTHFAHGKQVCSNIDNN